jgi:hypothetical protein
MAAETPALKAPALEHRTRSKSPAAGFCGTTWRNTPRKRWLATAAA